MMLTLILACGLLISSKALANPACAVCTVAVGASLEIARSLGVDDSVVGVWAGGFLALLGYWLILWFDRKGWRFFGRDVLLMAVSVGSIGFMYLTDFMYSPKVLGYIFYMDPLLFSTIFGALVLIYSSKFYQWMKARNGGHAHFPFEKVVVPVAALALVSIYFYYNPIAGAADNLLAGF